VALVGLAVPGLAQQPVTDKLQVNTTAASSYGAPPDVAMDGGGNFIVVWQGTSDGDGSGVFARRLDAAGNPIGTEFRVNESTTGAQGGAAVAMASAGEFVVVWHQNLGGGTYQLFGRRFGAAGTPLGTDFQINTAGVAFAGDVAADPRGGFVVAWTGYVSDVDNGVFARRYDTSGVPLGGAFRVNADATRRHGGPSVGVDATGNFVVAWEGRPPTPSPPQIGYLRRFDASGVPLSGDVPIVPDKFAFGVNVAVVPDGAFLTGWTDGYSLWTRAFDAAGTPAAPALRVDTDFSGYGATPGMAASMGGDGTFVVAWEQSDYFDEDYFNFRLVGQSFDRSGGQSSARFSIRPVQVFPDFQGPTVAMTDPGHVVTAWSEPVPFTGSNVFVRLFGGGLISGVVTNAVTGLPVAGAAVVVGTNPAVVTHADGRYTAVVADGSYDITVSRQGYATAFASGVTGQVGMTTVRDFALTPVPVLVQAGHVIDDSGPGGNGNGVVDANERFLITISVRNTGEADATGVSAALETLTSEVFFLQAAGTYPDIAPGQTTSGTAFDVYTSPGFPRGGLMRLRIRLATAQGEFTDVISFLTGSADERTGFVGTGPVDIPDRARTPGVYPITVSGFQGPITDVVIRLHVTHADVNELSSLHLVAPDGTRVILLNNFGGQINGPNLGTGCPAGVDDTSFSDSSTRDIGLANPPHVGSFSPETPLSAFVGKSGAAVNGTWRLEMTDTTGTYGSSSAGRIECARLVLDGYKAASGGYQEIRVAGVVTDGDSGAPLADATVSTTSGFATVTAPDGTYSLDVLPGTFDVVATAPGYAEGRAPGITATVGTTQTVNFALASVVLTASSVVVDDAGTGGNGNGVADRNERFQLHVTVANSDEQAATGVSALLSTATPGVTIVQATSTYPEIGPGGAAANAAPFELQTAADFVPGTAVDLRLAVATDQGLVTIPISLATGGVLSTPAAFSASGPLPVTRASAGGASLAIPVSGAPSPAARIALRLHVKHPNVNHLTLRLEGPDGTTVTLAERIGNQPPPGTDFGTDCPADANDTTFDDTATLWIGTAAAPRAGTFRPEQALAAFRGKDPSGTWTLRATNLNIDPVTWGTIECASLLVYGYASGDAAPPADLIFADGFDSGDLTAWSGVSTDNGDVRASTDAAMAGTPFGLETVVDDTQALHVRDQSPSDEPRYRARFYFDPNGFDPGEAVGRLRAIVFMALDEAPQKRVVQIILRRLGGEYSLRGRVALDDGTRAETPFVTIADGPHVVELDWVKASAPGASDGSFQLWIDGIGTTPLTGLDNAAYAVDLVRLGAMVIKPGAAGSLFFDRFDSRRATYIGP
jgi:hypothetical protein